MKKILLIGALLGAHAIQAQTFSDNFDSYTAGDYMAEQSGGEWTTWSDDPGSTEDVLVSSADAVSGLNSCYFSSNANGGGPTDLVREFGVLNTGQFIMNFNIKVPTGKAAYFNFQRNATIGDVWAMDCNFKDNGTISIVNQTGLSYVIPAYTQNVWFNFRIDINFNTNVWEVFLDDVSQGSFSNSENQIASIDIYPVDQDAPYSAAYYIDDFQYTVTPYTLPTLNAAINYVTYTGGTIAGNLVSPSVTVKNLGVNTISSFDLTTNYNGIDYTQSFSGLSLASLASAVYNIDQPIVLIAGDNNLTATVSNVNGAADGDASDDIGIISIDPVVPATGKMVVGEEGTGTWCQYCPRGAVFMDLMEENYGDFWAGVAVHNADPMTVTEYDAAVSATISGYPSGLVDRQSGEFDPSEFPTAFFDRITVAPTAFITNGATYDEVTRELNVSITANFQSAASSAYKLACVITEDDVTGTSSGYAQVNAYSGGGLGVMGGFELLGNPVPASQMVYNHVARAIEPSFEGFSGSFPTVVNAGETHTVNFNFILPTGWDENEIHIIGLLINPNGVIDNAGKATITKAVENGYVDGTDVSTGISDIEQIDSKVSVYPNPASDFTTITLNIEQKSDVSVKILNTTGQLISSKNYGSLNGASTINVNTSKLVAGVYMVEISLDNRKTIKRLIVK